MLKLRANIVMLITVHKQSVAPLLQNLKINIAEAATVIHAVYPRLGVRQRDRCRHDMLVMQKGKGKTASAAASQTPQPKLVISLEDGEVAENTAEDGAADSSQLEREIDATTRLLEGFNVHAATWEALEVCACHP